MAEDKNQSKKPIAVKPVQNAKPAFMRPQATNVNTEKYGPDYKHIIRIVNTDLKGEKKVLMALQRIKGISYMFSNFICYSAKIDPNKIAGKLTPEDVAKLEEVIRNPAKYI